jgi:AAA+ ATPase superfamily predicted ATPase
MDRLFKRKLYDRLLEWKRVEDGKSAILVEGARRVGKSTLVEQFAKNEYESYILIDFNEASEEVKSLFSDLMNKDYIFLQLQAIYNVVKHVPVPCFPNLIKNYIASMREVVEAYKKDCSGNPNSSGLVH